MLDDDPRGFYIHQVAADGQWVAEDRKEEGMRRAIDNARTTWKGAFRAELERLATTRHPFTSETVTTRVGRPSGLVIQGANNAVGAMVNAAARIGLIRKTGRRVKSGRPTSHAAELTEWIGTPPKEEPVDGTLSQLLATEGEWGEMRDNVETGVGDYSEVVTAVTVAGGSLTDLEGAVPVVRLTITTKLSTLQGFMGVPDARRLAGSILEIIEAGPS